MSPFEDQLHAVLADRHSPAARELFTRLMRYVHGRVVTVWSHTCRDLLDAAERDEVVGEVMEELIARALSRFRGESIGELLSYVRRVTDRTLIHRARRRLRERRLLEGEDFRGWSSGSAEPDVAAVALNPLSTTDQTWLSELFRSGSMAEHARRTDVSRAAVTLRVQRIRSRIDALAPKERDVVEDWLRRQEAGG